MIARACSVIRRLGTSERCRRGLVLVNGLGKPNDGRNLPEKQSEREQQDQRGEYAGRRPDLQGKIVWVLHFFDGRRGHVARVEAAEVAGTNAKPGMIANDAAGGA